MTNQLQVSAKGDREITMTRVFNAPRTLVWDAHTKPELIKRWLLGPDGWSMPVCEMDLRVGGKYRWVWKKDSDGTEMGTSGVFKEIVAPQRLVSTERFDDPWYQGEALNTHVFIERDGKTTLTLTMMYESKEARDGVLKSGMESGVAVSYDRLDEILAEGGN
jgi:uncharacterized protein YndB with AHSA1/START domain